MWIKNRLARRKAAAMWAAKSAMLASDFKAGALVRVPSLVMNNRQLFQKFGKWCRERNERRHPLMSVDDSGTLVLVEERLM